MPDHTSRFGLPLLQAGQAQKEVLHNEAIVALETLCQPVVESVGANTPPAAPADGASWIVGTAPVQAWASHPGALATWTDGGWRFAAPIDGMRALVRQSGLTARRVGTDWITGVLVASRVEIGGKQVVGSRQPAIADPAGGSIVDAECRTAIAQLLAAARTHGLIST